MLPIRDIVVPIANNCISNPAKVNGRKVNFKIQMINHYHSYAISTKDKSHQVEHEQSPEVPTSSSPSNFDLR